MPAASVTPVIQVGTVLGQSAVAVPHTGDTNEAILATIAVPANAIGKNGLLAVSGLYTTTNSANNKNLRLRFGASGSGTGGTSIALSVVTTVVTCWARTNVCNRNATNSQMAFGNWTGMTSTATINASAIDTTAATEINITGQLALGSETITLESYQVLLYYAA